MAATTYQLVKNGSFVVGRAPVYPTPTFWLPCDGDSITHGYLGNPFPMQLATMVRANFPSEVVADIDLGRFGNSWNFDWGATPETGTMISLAPTQIDPILAKMGTKWLIAFAGTNDYGISGKTPAQSYTDFQTYFNARITAGWTAAQIIVPTMLPRESAAESWRTTYNSSLVSGASTLGYKLARFDLDPIMGPAGAASNTTYYLDGLHPTESGGHPILTTILYNVMFP